MKEPKLIRKTSGLMDFRPTLGEPLTYDEGYDKNGKVDEDTWEEPGMAAAAAAQYGLPHKVEAKGGDQLGCGCQVAFLHAIGKVKDGQLEVDYMCDYGYHNYYVFAVNDNKTKKQLHLTTDGKLTNKAGFKATELETL